MEREIKGTHLSDTFWSLSEFAQRADADADDARWRISNAAQAVTAKGRPKRGRGSSDWFGGVRSFDEALELARTGWNTQLPDALALAEDMIHMAEREHLIDTFQPTWDVAGAEVDIGRYFANEPECMMEFPLTKVSRQGRVITLVASIGAQVQVTPEAIIQRGQLAVALALALGRLGHAVEIWADWSGCALKKKFPQTAYHRVLVKSVDDELDPATVMFALAHPAMLRALSFGVRDGYPGDWKVPYSAAKARGASCSRRASDIAWFPEGSIFLPEMTRKYTPAQVTAFIHQHLDKLGLLADDAE
jgi:hypothetical protein